MQKYHIFPYFSVFFVSWSYPLGALGTRRCLTRPLQCVPGGAARGATSWLQVSCRELHRIPDLLEHYHNDSSPRDPKQGE